MKKLLFSIVSLSLLFGQAQAVYMNSGSIPTGQVLPQNASIPAMVSVLDDLGTPVQFTPGVFNSVPSWLGGPFQHDCAATIIANDEANNTTYLLTAAHCVTDSATSNGQAAISLDSPNDKRLVVGMAWCPNNGSACIEDPTYTTVKTIYIHKNWIVDAFQLGTFPYNTYDFAILATSSELKNAAGNPIEPMQIAGENSPYQQGGYQLYVAGWGTTNYNEQENYFKNGVAMAEPFAAPNYTPVTSMSLEECQVAANTAYQILYGSNAVPPAFVTADPAVNICAGMHTESTACYGDSGGPLFATGNNNPNTWGPATNFTLVGNVSWSTQLCTPSVTTSAGDVLDNPHVYGYPGAVLCGNAQTGTDWYPDTVWIDTTLSALPPESAYVPLPTGLIKNLTCQ